MPGGVELVGLDSGLVWRRWWIQSGSVAKSWDLALRNWTDGVAIHCGSMGKVKDWEKKKNQELCFTYHSVLFPGGSDCKEPPAMWETWVWSLGQEDPLEKGMATHSSILAWRIPWSEEPDYRLTGYRTWGHKELHTIELLIHFFSQSCLLHRLLPKLKYYCYNIFHPW